MVTDWADGHSCWIADYDKYMYQSRRLRAILRLAQCSILEPYNYTFMFYGPVPNDRLQSYPNASLNNYVWSYNDCSARYLRDCSFLMKLKYFLKAVFLPTVGSCWL